MAVDNDLLKSGYGHLKAGSLYKKWASSNPNEAAKLDGYIVGLLAGLNPAPPVLATETGRGFVDWVNMFDSEVAPPPPPPPPPPSGVVIPRHGISLGARIIDKSSAAQDAELDLCVQVGAKTVRYDIWHTAEPEVRALVKKVVARNMVPFVIFSIDWVDNIDAYAPGGYIAWVKAQVQAFGSDVNIYEFANEPDLQPRCNPELYTQWLIKVYDAVKSVNPKALVVAPALWVWPSNPGGSKEWVRRMYAAGAKGHFDVLSLHLYDDPAEHGSWSAWDKAFVDSDCVRKVMDAHGDQAIPIISTESGGPTPKYSLQKQATIVHNALVDPRIAACYIYTMMDDDVPGFGLLDPSGNKRPAWDAFKAVAAT